MLNEVLPKIIAAGSQILRLHGDELVARVSNPETSIVLGLVETRRGMTELKIHTHRSNMGAANACLIGDLYVHKERTDYSLLSSEEWGHNTSITNGFPGPRAKEEDVGVIPQLIGRPYFLDRAHEVTNIPDQEALDLLLSMFSLKFITPPYTLGYQPWLTYNEAVMFHAGSGSPFEDIGIFF